MGIQLYNASIEPIIIITNGERTLLQPCETKDLFQNNGKYEFEIKHIDKKISNTFVESVIDLVSFHEKICTELYVDGQYEIITTDNDLLVKVKSYRYIIEKNVIYNTYVFSLESGQVHRKQLSVSNKERNIKNAKFWYFIGGNNKFLPLCMFALLVFVIDIIFAKIHSIWDWIILIGLAVCVLTLLIRYMKALKILKNAVKVDSILSYMLSHRKEYRRYQDDIIQKNMDANAGEDFYW